MILKNMTAVVPFIYTILVSLLKDRAERTAKLSAERINFLDSLSSHLARKILELFSKI